jgi:hypothetical protein
MDVDVSIGADLDVVSDHDVLLLVFSFLLLSCVSAAVEDEDDDFSFLSLCFLSLPIVEY